MALQTAAKLGPAKVPMLALYEPPYNADDEKHRQKFARQKGRVNELIRTGSPGEAAAYFMSVVGATPQAIEGMKASPDWEAIKQIDFTLAYDYSVLGDGTLPHDIAKSIAVPTLVLDGEYAMEFMHATADTLAQLIPQAERKTLKGQTHQVEAEALAPVLIEFFKREKKQS